MTSVDPTVVLGSELTDRQGPVPVRTYVERGTLVIGFLAPGARLSLDAAKEFRAAIDTHIKRMEIVQDLYRPHNKPTWH